MKKFSEALIFIVLVAGLLVSCGGNTRTGTFTFTYDGMPLSRSVADGETVTLVITLSGGYNATQSKTGTLSSFKGATFNFENIPLNTTFDLHVAIYRGETIDELNLLYEGSQTGLTVAEGTKAVNVAMQKFLNTPIVLYNRIYSNNSGYYDNEYNFFLTDEINIYSDDADFTSFNSNYFSFCFDADANFYALSNNNYVFSSKDEQSRQVVTIQDGSLNDITFDLENDTLWAAMRDNFKLCKLNLSDDSFTIYNGDWTDSGCYGTPSDFAINDNMAYFLFGYSNSNYTFPFCLVKYDLSKAEVDSENQDEFMFSINEDDLISLTSVNVSGTVTDMLYQDGFIYLIVRKVSLPSGSYTPSYYDACYYSRGAVVRVDPISGAYKILGWTDDTVDISKAGMYAAYQDSQTNLWTYYYKNEKKFVVDGSKTFARYDDGDLLINSQFPLFYSMQASSSGDISTSVFYGPHKFIAIKPKKLLVSDDGIAIYTNEDGALTYRNVNRVVTIDLESFAISQAVETNAKFIGENSSSYSSGDFNGVFKNQLATTGTAFYYSANEYVCVYGPAPWAEPVTTPYLYMPCADAE